MEILALIPSQLGHSPGQRGGIELWESVLKPEGIELDFAPFETEKLQQILTRAVIRSEKRSRCCGDMQTGSNCCKIWMITTRFLFTAKPLFLARRFWKNSLRKKTYHLPIGRSAVYALQEPVERLSLVSEVFRQDKEIIRISKVVMDIVGKTHLTISFRKSTI